MTGNENLEEFEPGSNENTPNEMLQNADLSKKENDSSLEALINQEQSLPHEQLQAELGREPTREEVDEWLRAHTESYWEFLLKTLSGLNATN